MASKKLLCFLFVHIFALGSATYCSDCSLSESCCSDKVCRQRCFHCSDDYQCGTKEQCCDNKCISSFLSCSCSHDFQCDTGEQCCNSKCISSSFSCSCTYDYHCGIGVVCCGEFVPHTVVGAVELLQAPLSARLSSSPSSFPSYPAAAVLVARTTAIVHPIMWSSPTNNPDKK